MADLIDRQAVLKGIDENISHLRELAGGDEMLNRAIDLVQYTRDFIAGQRTIEAEPVKHGRWIDAKKRTPNEEERSCAIVGIVNGNNGHINFDNGLIFVRYDTDEGAWWSDDYDIEGCSVDYWLAIPNFNPNCGAKMDLED